MPREVTMKEENTITIQFPVPATREQTNSIVARLASASHDGFRITGIGELLGGDQRDPYTIGGVIRLEKK